MSSELVVNNVNDIVMYQEQTFNSVCVDDKITFAKESQFAMQLMQKNDFLNKIAWGNQASLQNAIINVASIGISLNPAKKHAYLVPRDQMVCLDISYIGLMHLAMATGSILWGQCKIVRSNDTYTNNGLDKAPTHTSNTFGDRGEVIGVYCTVKTPQGDYLTDEMSVAEIKEIENISKSKNSKFSPWKTFWNEMARKTVVKRASKYWPQVDRLDDAIHMLNTEGNEGMSTKAEKVQEVIVNPSDAIGQSLTKQGKSWEQFFEWAGKMLKKEVASLDDLTDQELQTFASKLEAR
jgi:recombination protein RecT